MRPARAPFRQHPRPSQTRPNIQAQQSAPQQVMQPNPNGHAQQFPNSSQPPALNVQCPMPSNGLNTQFSNFNGNNPHFPNVNNQYLQMQNAVLAAAQLIQQGQFIPQNTIQNLNTVASSILNGHLNNIPQNFNQMAIPQPNGQWFMNNNSQVPRQRPFQMNMGANQQGAPFNFVNPPQHMNQVPNTSQGPFPQYPSNFPQMVPFNMPLCSNPMMGTLNQGFQSAGVQNSAFMMNPQFGMGNSNEVTQNAQGQQMFAPPTMGHQNLPMNSHPSLTTGQAQMQQPNTFQGSQGEHSKRTGSNATEINKRNPEDMNPTRNHEGSGKRESETPRYSTANHHPTTNGKPNFSPFNGKHGKGHLNKRKNKPHPSNITQQNKEECRRTLTLSYSEKEIKEWRDERRKYHPSKKLDKSGVFDNEARKRCQQLKEILAKQAELGVEVAELPPNYLLDMDSQVEKSKENGVEKGKEHKTWPKKGPFKNKYEKRQRHGKFKRSKKQKLRESGSSPIAVPNMKEPTLLQKLLSSDIKRDKSHLLQAFKFMVLNSFFKDWPEKPLEFPKIIVKDEVEKKSQGDEVVSGIMSDGKILEEFEDLSDQELALDEDHGNAEDMLTCGHIGESGIGSCEVEEGEITDPDA